MASSVPLIGWPPPENVYWECPYCGPGPYSVLRASPRPAAQTAGTAGAMRSVVEARVLKCDECGCEHLTSYYRDGFARVAGGHSKGWAGTYEFMATDGCGRWKLMRRTA